MGCGHGVLCLIAPRYCCFGKFRIPEQIDHAHIEVGQNPVRKLRRQLPDAFEHIVHLRLRDAEHSCKPALGEFPILQAQCNVAHEAGLQVAETNLLLRTGK